MTVIVLAALSPYVLTACLSISCLRNDNLGRTDFHLFSSCFFIILPKNSPRKTRSFDNVKRSSIFTIGIHAHTHMHATYVYLKRQMAFLEGILHTWLTVFFYLRDSAVMGHQSFYLNKINTEVPNLSLLTQHLGTVSIMMLVPV